VAEKCYRNPPMDWLTFRGPDEARSDRETPPSVTEILPELLIGEYPRPEDGEDGAAFLSPLPRQRGAAVIERACPQTGEP
jgi:hypothetical protein